MFKKLVFISLLMMVVTANAAVRKPITNGETVTVKLSNQDPNIISIQNDRIEKVSSVKGAMLNQLDAKRGVLTTKPNKTMREPFSLIIFSEKGNRYTLMVVPVAIPSQDIILTPETHGITGPVDFERRSPYTEMVVSLIRHMANGTQPEDYQVKISDEKPIKFRNGKLKITSLYLGEKVHGEILNFTSTMKCDFKVSEKYFSGPEVLAVTISKDIIKPKETVQILRVVKNV